MENRNNVTLKKILNYFLFTLLLINPLLSLIFDNTKIYYHYITLPLIFIILFALYFRKITKKKLALFFFIILIFVAFLLNFFNNADLGKINNHFFNYLDFILICFYFSNRKNLNLYDSFLSNKKYFLIIILSLINILELYLFVTKKGFMVSWSWGGNFFVGTNSHPHTLAYLMLVVIIISLYMTSKYSNRFYLVYCILPFILISESGARVALIMASFLGIIFSDLLFSKKNSSRFLKILKLFLICCVLFISFKDYILSSDLMNKIIKRQNSGNSSAGRIILWKYLLNLYFNSPNKWVFGFGDDKVYYYSYLIPKVHVNIWAHSDYIQVIFGKGLVGIILYASAIYNFINKNSKENGNLYSYLIIFVFIVGSFLNGFYNYRDIMLALPYMMLLNDYLKYSGKEKRYE